MTLWADERKTLSAWDVFTVIGFLETELADEDAVGHLDGFYNSTLRLRLLTTKRTWQESLRKPSP